METTHESNSSGVSWAAVIAGGFVTAALSLILLALGAGLGLSSISFWSNAGASASTLGAGAIIWLILMEIMSSSLGGYLAGRLRTKWATIHSDEVYFRDTVHGLLAWSVALVITAAFLGSAATAMVGGAAASASASSGSRAENGDNDRSEYFVDMLLRSDGTKPENGEVGRIFARAMRQGEIPAGDKTYLDQIVASRTGLSQADADKRVTSTFAAAQEAAEAVRKKVAHALLWVFIALLFGAFCASFAATLGGRQRDHVRVV